MCPPGGNTFRFPPSEANAYRPGLRGNRTFWGHISFAPHIQPIQTAHHGRTLGSAPTHGGEGIAKTVSLWLTSCLQGRNGQGHSLRVGYFAPFRCFTVGADPCVRPAETRSGFLHLRRMRTTPVSGKMGSFGYVFRCFLHGTNSYCPPRADTWVRPYAQMGKDCRDGNLLVDWLPAKAEWPRPFPTHHLTIKPPPANIPHYLGISP